MDGSGKREKENEKGRDISGTEEREVGEDGKWKESMKGGRGTGEIGEIWDFEGMEGETKGGGDISMKWRDFHGSDRGEGRRGKGEISREMNGGADFMGERRETEKDMKGDLKCPIILGITAIDFRPTLRHPNNDNGRNNINPNAG